MVCFKLITELLNKFSAKYPEAIQNVVIPGIKKGEIIPENCAKSMYAGWVSSTTIDTLPNNHTFAYNSSVMFMQPQITENHPFITTQQPMNIFPSFLQSM